MINIIHCCELVWFGGNFFTWKQCGWEKKRYRKKFRFVIFYFLFDFWIL